VRVEDDGDPPASVTGNVRVLVLPRPMVTARLGMAGVLRLEWEAIPGCRYVVEFKERLDDPGWTALGPAVAAGGTRLHLVESLSERSRFYRVRVAPVE